MTAPYRKRRSFPLLNCNRVKDGITQTSINLDDESCHYQFGYALLPDIQRCIDIAGMLSKADSVLSFAHCQRYDYHLVTTTMAPFRAGEPLI